MTDQEHQPSAEDEKAESKPGAREQWLRWVDPGKPPLNVLRWLAVLGIALAWWAQGAPTSPAHAWVPYVVIAGVVILPDIAGFAVGGFRLDLKQAQDDIAALRQEVNAQARANSVAVVALGNDALNALVRAVPSVTQPATDQASGPRTPWTPPASTTPAPGDVA